MGGGATYVIRSTTKNFFKKKTRTELVRTNNSKIPHPLGTSKAFTGTRWRQCREGQEHEILLRLQEGGTAGAQTI